MKNTLLQFLLLLLCAVPVRGQITGAVRDKATGKPIAYANIWVEDENIGVTSTEDGSFSFADAKAIGKKLVITCLGYERGVLPITAEEMEIALEPVPIALQEVVVKPSARRQKAIVGALEKRKYSHWYANGGTPWIVAEFFPYDSAYAGTPFLDAISFTVSSDIKNAKFQIRLLEVAENGEPGKDLLAAPLIAFAPKSHHHIIRIEVSQYNLQIPQEGFFIAFEWFIIEENRYEYTYTMKGSKEKRKGLSYEPSIRSHQPSADQERGWIYMKGAWTNSNAKANKERVRLHQGPQFQLTLSD